MKKTVIVNISGMVFHIDEDAYQCLGKYLESLTHFFGNNAEGNEIIADIEARIAELLQPKISDLKQSISIEDINEILGILGTPEDIAGSPSEASEGKTEPVSYPISKRLYRDIDNSMIGGVSSGLGAYFGIDSIFFKIIFIALLFAGGVGLITYVLLWIVVPAARTSSQKLEMKGEDITLGNIEKTVKGEYAQVKSNNNKAATPLERFGSFIHELFELFGVFLKAIFSVLRYFIGAFLILMAVFFSIAIIAGLYFKNFAIPSDFNHYYGSVQDFMHHLISPFTTDMLLLLLFIILVLPVAGLIYLGLKLIIRFKAQHKWIIVVLTVFWFVSLVSFTVLVFNEIDNFKSEATNQNLDHFPALSGKTIYVEAKNPDENNGEFLGFYNHSRLFFPIGSGENSKLAGVVTVDIERTEGNQPEILIIRKARGDHQESAQLELKNISYNYLIKDSAIHLDPFFSVPGDEKWNFYHIRIVFRLPIGQKIFLDESLKYLLDNVENANDVWDREMTSKSWVMTSEGLDLFGSENSETQVLQDYGNKVLNLQLRDHMNIDKDKYAWYAHNGNYGTLHTDGKKLYYGTIRLDVRKSETDKVSIELIRHSSGDNPQAANKLSNAIEYSYEQKDSVVWLDPVFCFPEDYPRCNQQLTVVIRLPIQSKIYINHDFEPMVEKLASDHDSWAEEFTGHTYVLTSDGLNKMDQ